MNTDEVFEPQVAVVDFHHHRGPEIEFWITTAGNELCHKNDWTLLPFLALADGAHAVVEEFSYFTLLNKSDTTLHVDTASTKGTANLEQQTSSETKNAGISHGGTNPDTHKDALGAVTEFSEVALATETPNPKQALHTSKNGSTLFGIACIRQIRSDKLKYKSEDMTRSTVQKAVVVILQRPASLGGVRERLGAVTAAWFAQEDFRNHEILDHFQESLRLNAHAGLSDDHHLGLSIREILHDFRHQTLIMFKALLLQKKILFFSNRCERLCLLQFALISLIPELMRNLQDCADPALDSYARTITRAVSLRSSERSSLLAYMGLPLQIFGESSFFSPYTPLQLLDVLMDKSTHSFVVGSTNSLLLAQKDRYCDILINLDDEYQKINILDQGLRDALTLSAADRRWIDNVTQSVLDTWDPSDPSRTSNYGYVGSEDAIRLQFEEYILSLLSSVAYKMHHDVQPLFDNSHASVEPTYPEPNETLNDFNHEFVAMWRKTHNYALFDRLTQAAGIFDIIEPKHPTAGGLNIEDVQRRLAQGVAELHLDERMKEGRETVGRVLGESKERVGAGVARFWKEVEDFRQRRETNQSRDARQRGSVDPSALKDNITNIDTNVTKQPDTQATTPTLGTWASAIRERAAQIQTPEINTAQLSSTARDNAAKAGQYLSSWGSWARDRSRGWGENRRGSAEKPATSTDKRSDSTS